MGERLSECEGHGFRAGSWQVPHCSRQSQQGIYTVGRKRAGKVKSCKSLGRGGEGCSKGCVLLRNWAASTFCSLLISFVLPGTHMSYLVSQDRAGAYFLLSGPCWTLGKWKPQFNTTLIIIVSVSPMCIGGVIILSAAFTSEGSKAQGCSEAVFPKSAVIPECLKKTHWKKTKNSKAAFKNLAICLGLWNELGLQEWNLVFPHLVWLRTVSVLIYYYCIALLCNFIASCE